MNYADMVVAIAVGVIILLAAAIMRRNKRNGTCGCGRPCSSCGSGCGKSAAPDDTRHI